VECNNLARAAARIGHDDLEFVSIFGGLEQIELNRRFVLPADLFADVDKAAGCSPGSWFPLSFEQAELAVQLRFPGSSKSIVTRESTSAER